MDDLFLQDSLDTSPIVFSDCVFYTPRHLLRRLPFCTSRRLEICRQRCRILPCVLEQCHRQPLSWIHFSSIIMQTIYQKYQKRGDRWVLHLADQFFISKFYLTRVFKEQFGVSINIYVQNLRITKAKQMLRFTDKKLDGKREKYSEVEKQKRRDGEHEELIFTIFISGLSGLLG